MTPVRIREARAEEAAALEDLQRHASLQWDEYRADLLAHPDAIEVEPNDVEGGGFRVAVRGDRRLGFSAVLDPVDGIVELDGLFVDPASWHGGVGRALVVDAAQRAAQRGAGSIRVVANPRAVGFYERVGFAATGVDVPTRFGPGREMVLPLDPGP